MGTQSSPPFDAALPLTVVCAWCAKDGVAQPVPIGAVVSHGICQEHRDGMLRELNIARVVEHTRGFEFGVSGLKSTEEGRV